MNSLECSASFDLYGEPFVFLCLNLFAEEPDFQSEVGTGVGWCVKATDRGDLPVRYAAGYESIDDSKMTFVENVCSTLQGIHVSSSTVLVARKRAVILRLTLQNTTAKKQIIPLQLNILGSLDYVQTWDDLFFCWLVSPRWHFRWALPFRR